MKQILIAAIFVSYLAVSGCSGATKPYHNRCSTQLSLAWKELDLAKAAGFAGTVNYSKAASLITLAKTMQTVENYDNCYRHAKKARFYIAQSRKKSG